jgi:hypothetical protein
MREPEELLPATRRALLHRVATGQAEGRTPSLVGASPRAAQPHEDGWQTC